MQLAAIHQQKFKNIIEGARIRAIGRNHRKELIYVVAELFADDCAFTRVHCIHITKQCIDLAVMAHKAIRLSTFPGWERISAKPRMHHG